MEQIVPEIKISFSFVGEVYHFVNIFADIILAQNTRADIHTLPKQWFSRKFCPKH
jgi:hypothetical protein